MASIQRLDTTSLSSPDRGLHNVGGPSHRNFGAGLEKSHTFRDGHEGRASGGGGPSTSHGEGPLTSGLFLESIRLPNAKSNAQVELRRAMNAASGQGSDDPTLGNIQCKALENCSAEEIKRVRAGLLESMHRARERGRHLSEAVIRVDRFQNAMQSRKRNRADGVGHDRGSHGGPGQRGAGATLGHVTKGGGRGASSSGEGSGLGTQKGGDKSKRGVINKRMRTSLADVRPEGRPSNLSVQRSSGVQERARESPRSSGLVSCAVEEKERGGVGGSEGWEKTKMKGRRSATIKAETSVVSSANGVADGERKQKGSVQVQRGGGDGRSRPSEGHGFRSVPGSVSVQKAESVVQASGCGIRGGSKLVAGDGAAQPVGKAERGGLPERERSNGKGGAKPVGRDEVRAASPGMIPKAKGARAPRSNLVAGGNQSAQMGRSSSFADVREKASVTSPAKVQVPSGPTNRKRAAPSRSSSPPVASWGSSRPQKKARARRVNVMPPVSISVPAKEEANGVEEAGTGLREGSALGATPSSRSTPGGAGGGGSVAKRASGGVGGAQIKEQTERSMVSVGPVESMEYLEDGQKTKGRRRKQEDEEGEQKVSGSSEKSGGVVVAMGRAVMVAGEESGGVDGVRRQGRTGRGPGTARVASVSSAMEKLEGAAASVKASRIGRATVETKLARVGRSAQKKGTTDRKTSGRPRRSLGNSVVVMPELEYDVHEQLSRAVQLAVEFSAAACLSDFWREFEPYFTYVTSDDLSILHNQMATAGESNTVTHRLDGAVKFPFISKKVTECDGVESLNNSSEQSMKERSFRRGRSGGWYAKVFPLSQRLLSAFISELDDDDREKVSDEACVNRDPDSPLPLSSHSEMDYDRRVAEGESDVDNLKPESEHWSAGAKERSSPMCCGQGSRLSVEDQDGDDILAGNYGHQSGGADWGNGVEVDNRDDEAGFGRQLGNGLMDWDEQYRRMSLDDRLLVELSSIGLLPVQPRMLNELEVDEISAELGILHSRLTYQVSNNKEHLCRLESAIVEKREAEERAREKLAMDKFVELAYRKKTRRRYTKGAAAQGARAAALALAHTVLARVQEFEAGQSCIIDPALRDRLFCIPPSLVESTPDFGSAERINSDAAGGAEDSAGQRMEETVRTSFVGQSRAIDFGHLKEEAWPSREHSLEDVTWYTSTRDVNTLSSNALGAIKGKRSERDRDVEVKDGGAPVRSGPSNAKGERKSKTKPRQKTGPLLKPIQGLVPKAADHQSAKGRSSNQGHQGYSLATESHATRDEAIQSLPVLQEQIDLSGMEEMSMAQVDMNSWLDFHLEDPLQPMDDLSMGLDVPMDDLSGLNF